MSTTGLGIVTRLTNVAPIEGADNIVSAKVLGETVIVGKEFQEGDLGILFDIESILSPEYLRLNNLYRHSELNADKTKIGYFGDNGRVKPIKLRGIKVSGYFAHLDSLRYTNAKIAEGDLIGDLGKHHIAKKYVPKVKILQGPKQAKKSIECIMFKEHFDTDQLLRSLQNIPEGQFIVTTKLHGTSCRYGNLLVKPEIKWYEKPLTWFSNYKSARWTTVVGSRHVTKHITGILEKSKKGYYAQDIHTKAAIETFGDRLLKGETIYFEIVGYAAEDRSIMPPASTKALEKFLDKKEYKEYINQYGEIINYTYGCKPGEYAVYVYRITHTTVDGDSFDLTWEQLKTRCEKLGVNHVPELDPINIYKSEGRHYSPNSPKNLEEFIEDTAQTGVHNNTPPEGICFRYEDYPTCKIWKYKTTNFKILEGLLKDQGVVDMEESPDN